MRQYITAGREDEQVPDKSMFKRCFLLGLDRRQHPQFGKINNPDLDRGDFIFAVSKKIAKAPEKPPEVSAYTDELQKLRGEFLKLQKLLEARSQSESREKETLSEKKDLEEKIKRSEQEQKEQQRIRDEALERERKEKELEARLRLEAAEKKSLEEELRRIRAEQEARSRQDAEQRKVLDEELKKTRGQQQSTEAQFAPTQSAQPAGNQPPQVALIPPAVKTPGMKSPKTLRSKPIELSESDLKKMLLRHNFYVKHGNEEGEFQNDWADNGDGTVTDRFTALMWQKGGSPSTMEWLRTKDYVDELNASRFGGYADWRIPSLEELCSLLDKRHNRKLLLHPIFEEKQKICWSSDWIPPSPVDGSFDILFYYIVDFEKGLVLNGSTGGGRWGGLTVGRNKELVSVRAVRTLHP